MNKGARASSKAGQHSIARSSRSMAAQRLRDAHAAKAAAPHGVRKFAASPAAGQKRGVRKSERQGSTINGVSFKSRDISISGNVPRQLRSGLVIGKVRSLTDTLNGRTSTLMRDTVLQKGDRTLLKQLPNRGSVKANVRQNTAKLVREMGKGKPIRDGSVDADGKALETSKTGFLKLERYVLKSRNWRYDEATKHWHPPAANDDVAAN